MWKKLKFEFITKGSFLVVWTDVDPLEERSWCLKILIWKPTHWTWGINKDWYDGPINDYGLGPLINFNTLWW